MPAFPNSYEVAILGQKGVGRITFSRNVLLYEERESYDPTLGDDVLALVVDGVFCRVFPLPMSYFEEGYTAMSEHTIKTSHGFILMYSVTSKESFDQLQAYYNLIMKLRGPNAEQPNQSLPGPGNSKSTEYRPPIIVLVGNKIDRVSEREVHEDEGRSFGKEHGCPFFETSNVTKENVLEPYYEVVRGVRLQYKLAAEKAARTAPGPTPGIALRHPKEKKSLPRFLRRLCFQPSPPGAGHQ